ncbi:MAG: YMGG-like glycine zipper-containing protein [Alphaproteobacteria bacterium]
MKTISKTANLIAVAAVVLVTGCSGMSTTQQRTLSGAAIGTGVGAAGTAMTGGCVTCGAAIGAAAGAAGGYVYDQHQKNKGN